MPFLGASNPDAPFMIAIHGQLVGGGIEVAESFGLLVTFVPPTVGTFTSEIVIIWQDGQSGTI